MQAALATIPRTGACAGDFASKAASFHGETRLEDAIDGACITSVIASSLSRA
jgi:hypothetical protein